jgi:ribosome-binding protein aMBF1 (putative translation factor)
MSVADAARKVHITGTRLEEWESGKVEPTINQLGKLADAYKRPLAVFFLPSPPEEASAPPDFRRFEVSKPPPLSPELRLAIRRARLKRQTALELAEELGERPTRFEVWAQLTDSPEQVATQLRSKLGFESNETVTDAREQFNRRRTALEQNGVLVFQAEKVSLEEMRGFSITDRPLTYLLVIL